MIKPLKDYVVLLPEKEETKTESGIILTTDEKDKQSLGIVNNVGPEVKDLKKVIRLFMNLIRVRRRN